MCCGLHLKNEGWERLFRAFLLVKTETFPEGAGTISIGPRGLISMYGKPL
jgi:hypothetical protein